MNKKISRLRRAKKTRSKIKELQVVRLSVHRTPRHIYAQVIATDGKVLLAASTLDKEIKKECAFGGNVKAAQAVGKAVAKRAVKQGISEVAFDRSGFRYHGRVRALADAAREHGLKF
ncbi:MAG: 50S ribosomal protein L18 [Gammaproteobacteria bacterium]